PPPTSSIATKCSFFSLLSFSSFSSFSCFVIDGSSLIHALAAAIIITNNHTINHLSITACQHTFTLSDKSNHLQSSQSCYLHHCYSVLWPTVSRYSENTIMNRFVEVVLSRLLQIFNDHGSYGIHTELSYL